MTILVFIVPPTGAAGSHEHGLPSCLLFLFCFFLSYADSPWLSLYFIFSLFLSISRIEGVVWRGWMTNLLCSFRTVWRQGAGLSWRTQGGDCSLRSKVLGELEGIIWLYYSYHKLPPPPGGCFGLRSACFFPFVIFPLVLCLTYSLFTSGFFSFLFELVFIQVLATSPARGGGTTDCFFNFFFHFFSFFLLIFLLSFCFLFDWLISFL